MNADVRFEKEKVKESQSRSVTPSLDTPSGAGLGRHNILGWEQPGKELKGIKNEQYPTFSVSSLSLY